LSILPQEVRSLIHDQLQLTALEVRLASRSLMAMIVAAVCISVLMVLVWVGLMVAIGLSLLDAGLQPVHVVLVVTVVNSVFAFLLFGFIRIRSRDLGLPATMRALKPSRPEGQGQQNQDRALSEPDAA
jgi:uncharacterized RDD family membrane protein YckC